MPVAMGGALLGAFVAAGASLSVASASIRACSPVRISSANTLVLSALLSASSWASSAEWSWVIA